MPKLSAYRDNDALDNAIAGKIIVYVEGPDDVAFFKNLAGPNIVDRLEFKTPESGTGYLDVKRRVQELRSDNNLKVHGLLDGEAAVHLGEVDGFLDNTALLFRSEAAPLRGLLFLSEYELENLLIRHSPIARLIKNHVPIRDLGTLEEAEIQQTIDRFGRRFYLFSLVKFAMVGLHSEERACKGVAKIGGQFLDRKQSAATVMRKTVKPQISDQLDYEEFRAAVRALAKRLRKRYDAEGLDGLGRQAQVNRIADGKEWLKHIKDRFKGNAGWDGVLHAELTQSPYCAEFRAALLAETRNDDEPTSDHASRDAA